MAETLLNTNQNQLNTEEASYAEFISSVNLGKQNLVRELVKKGANVSSSDNLSSIADAVSSLECTGTFDYLISEWSDSVGSAVLNSIVTGVSYKMLPLHNAMIGVNSVGRISIYQLNSSASFTEIAYCDCTSFLASVAASNYIFFGFSKDETKIAYYDASNKKAILLTMDWNTKTLTQSYTYTVTADIGIGGSGTHTYNSNTVCGICPSEDGTKMAIITTLDHYIYVNRLDMANQTESIGQGNGTSYGYYAYFNGANYDFHNATYHYDTTESIVYGFSYLLPKFKFTITFGSYPTAAYTLLQPKKSTYHNKPLYLWDKGYYITIGSSTNEDSINTVNVLYLIDITTGDVLDSIKIKQRDNIRGMYNYGYPHRFNNVSSNIQVGYIRTTVGSTNTDYIYLGAFIRVSIDDINKKFILVNNNGCTNSSSFICTSSTVDYNRLSSSNLSPTLINPDDIDRCCLFYADSNPDAPK